MYERRMIIYESTTIMYERPIITMHSLESVGAARRVLTVGLVGVIPAVELAVTLSLERYTLLDVLTRELGARVTLSVNRRCSSNKELII